MYDSPYWTAVQDHFAAATDERKLWQDVADTILEAEKP
jgi:hypothetical protein